MRTNGRLTLSAAILLAGTALAHAETLRVVGNSRVDEASILAQIPVGNGQKASEAALDEGLKSLFATGQFDDVKISRKNGEVVVEVKERPVLSAVVFNGNKKLKDDALLKSVSAKPGQPYPSWQADYDAVGVSEAYSKIGLVDAAVTTELKPQADGSNHLVFNVKEGSKVPVAQVWFKGNESFDDARLRSVISTKENGLFSWLTRSDVYDADRITDDREAIRAFYVSQGYADARVLLSDVDRHDEGFIVGFVVDEGPLYSVASVAVDSTLSGFDEKAAKTAVAGIEGKPLTPAALNAAADRLTEAAMKGGFPSATATPRVTRNDDGTASVSFDLDRGPNVYIERIDIVGNDRTREYVIRRELDFSEGDLLNRLQLRQAERRLKELGIFEAVSLAVAPGKAADRALLRVEVAERKTGEFSIGGGYSTKDGPIATVSLAEANLFGSGRKTRITAGRGDGTSEYGFSFTEPYLFGQRITARTDVFHRSGDREHFGSHAYDEKLSGGKLALSAPLSDNLSASVHYTLVDREVSNVDARYAGEGTSSDPDLVRPGTTLKSAIGYGLTWDMLDDPANPKDGYRIAFGQEFAGLGGDARYLKSEIEGDWYRHLSPTHDLVARLGIKAGHVTGLGSALDFSDHFRATADMARGFEKGGFGPRDETSGYHLGGTAFVSGTAEASVPLPLIPAEYGFRGVVFADAAALWSPDSRRVSQSGATVAGGDGIRASVGTGVIWDSPFGLLRADFAVPVAKESGDREQVFSFSGGTRF